MVVGGDVKDSPNNMGTTPSIGTRRSPTVLLWDLDCPVPTPTSHDVTARARSKRSRGEEIPVGLRIGLLAGTGGWTASSLLAIAAKPAHAMLNIRGLARGAPPPSDPKMPTAPSSC